MVATKKEIAIEILRRRFPYIKNFKVMLYRNPNDCCRLELERVNPTHVGIVWGWRNRKQRKSKGNNPIKIAEMYFNILPLALGLTTVAFIDAFTGYVSLLLLHVGVYSLVVSFAVSVALWGYYGISLDNWYNRRCVHR